MEADIISHAGTLKGRRLGELGDFTSGPPVARSKGAAGHIVERFFGITQNSLSEPDFPAAGIELKVVPVVSTAKGRRVKERTVITMIDYARIVSETWDGAHVRKKLDLLLVYYEHLVGQPIDSFPIITWMRWNPEGPVEALFKHDWEAIRAKVVGGRAEDLTESEGFILGACTKGPGGGALRPQPNSAVLAPSRAFALKPSFTLNLLLDAERTGLAERQRLGRLRTGFHPFVGGTVGELAESVGIPPSKAKDWKARVARRGIARAAGCDIEALGLTVRVPWVDPNFSPYEHVSFPAFRHLELVEEEWEDSLLLSYIEYMLLCPVQSPTRATLPSRCRILEPVYWRPTQRELTIVRSEWEGFRDRVREGKARDLPRPSDTRIIHVRTHGRDSTDTDPLPDGSRIPKRSFWLNGSFVQQLLREAYEARR